MPSELRKIIFTKDELWKAVVSHCMHADIFMPNAPLEDVVVPKDLHPATRMLFAGDQKGSYKEVDLGMPEVAAALIRYCRESSVPLPRHGKKVLMPEGEGIAMLVNVAAQEALRRSA